MTSWIEKFRDCFSELGDCLGTSVDDAAQDLWYLREFRDILGDILGSLGAIKYAEVGALDGVLSLTWEFRALLY
jgi:hypothetical protein